MEEIKEACGIKIGDYIRDETGKIFRLTDKELEEEIDEIYWYGDGMCTGCYSNQVVKHSPNIIDLIQKDDVGIMNCYGLLVKKFITESDILELKLGNYELLKVVTKEQFANAEYRLEE